ncbi:hypothetical protein KM043_018774 [Ampulex compressa]|nr:hypothetical protein KM043_018774 [Ampulex compressa]
MLQAAIVLWLLASIYGLEVADAVKRDVNTQSNAFDPEQTKIHVQKKIGDLIAEGMTDFRDARVLLSIIHKNASLVFQTKLTQELDDVHLAVQIAQENGRNATYCIQDTENTLRALREDAELKFSECEAASWNDSIKKYDIITEIVQAGFRALKEIKNIHLRLISKSCVDGAE